MYSIKKSILPVLLIAFVLLSACGKNRGGPSGIGEAPGSDIVLFGANIVEGVEDISPVEGFIVSTIKTHRNIIAGLAITVFSENEILYGLQYGYADVTAGLAIDSDTVFEWGSIAKLLVYVSVMQLYERGQLDLHADIFSYVSQEFFPNIHYTTTMHHLINHTAGFENDYWQRHGGLFSDFVPMGEPVPTLEDTLKDIFTRRFTNQRLQPGMMVRYSNEGIALAGYIVSQISGLSFYEYVHINIFEPLGMTRTALSPDLSDNCWVSLQRDKIKIYEVLREQSVQRWQDTIFPSGSATGTISDLIKFARALIPDEDGASILFDRPETLAMLFPSLEEIQNIPICVLTGFRFFNGLIVFSLSGDSNRILGHTGGTKGFRSQLMIDVDRGIGLVIGENNTRGAMWIGDLPQGLAEMVFN